MYCSNLLPFIPQSLFPILIDQSYIEILSVDLKNREKTIMCILDWCIVLMLC